MIFPFLWSSSKWNHAWLILYSWHAWFNSFNNWQEIIWIIMSMLCIHLSYLFELRKIVWTDIFLVIKEMIIEKRICQIVLSLLDLQVWKRICGNCQLIAFSNLLIDRFRRQNDSRFLLSYFNAKLWMNLLLLTFNIHVLVVCLFWIVNAIGIHF
jgi:hypothetical protein